MADRNDDQTPGPTGPAGDDTGHARACCRECGTPLAADQRYCVNCGARRGLLPAAVAGTVAAVTSKGKAAAAAAAGKPKKGESGGGEGKGDGNWSWMPSPPAIAIAVIGMLALGVGLGSAMSEIASSAPLSTILLEYPQHAVEAPPAEEPEEEEVAEEEPELAAAPEEEAGPEIIEEAPLPEEVIEEGPLPEGAEEPELVPFNPEAEEENFLEEGEEAPLPEVEHAFLIVLGEGGYEETFGATSSAPYLSRVLPKKGELLPNYYGVTNGVLANEIALLSGQGPTPETAANCPNYTAIAPGTVSAVAEQVEGNGCVYGEEVKSLPTLLTEKELSWRAYVQDMENGGSIGQPWRCRKPTLGGPDTTVPTVGDQYATWRNPVVYFSPIAAGDECEKHDVGFELLSKDLSAKKKTPALSLIFPNACHSGGEYECEPGAPKGAQGVAAELKTLVPAIMASPAYEEGGLIMITSAQAPQAGEHLDQKACCLAPAYPNLPAAATPTTTPAPTATTPSTPTAKVPTAEPATETTTGTTTRYTEESVLETGGGGKVGLLMISPYVEPGKVEEAEYANHFTLLKTLATMLGVEPTGYAAEAEMPALSATLFKSSEEVEAEEKAAAEESSKGKKKGSASAFLGALTRLLRSEAAPPARAGRSRGTS
ncbi:MAG: zinc ribbon domain-containing protein [Actinobacteria bacterium]|nr:zinc ribbon domain-containing protein [Actinomycetota bacterium]